MTSVDNETTMQILTHSLVLSSAVGGRGSELREIFRTEYSDPLTDQFLLLDYKADAAGVQDIKLAVDSPRIYLVLARATQDIRIYSCCLMLYALTIRNYQLHHPSRRS